MIAGTSIVSDDRIDEAVELLTSILLTTHRKMSRGIFKTALVQIEGNLSSPHLLVMRALQLYGCVSMTEIGDETAISKSQMTHLTNRLISLDMVERTADPHDRRRISIQLTAKGRRTIQKLEQAVKKHVKARLSPLSDGDVDKLTTSLRAITEVLAKVE
jgi:DNA-binding MarR family transcriptional regulator